MLRLFLILIFVSLSATLTSQLSADFESDDLSLWEGDLANFIINDEQRLQLNANESGQSIIFTALDFADSLSWTIDVELKFGGSSANMLTIWLAVDDITSDQANGYKLEIGETGNNDAIRFLHVVNGEDNQLASGDMGQVAVPFELSIAVIKDVLDNWTLTTQAHSDSFPIESFTVNHPTDFFPTNAQFGLECLYTNTRVNAFYFDNIIINELLPDSEAPGLAAFNVVNPSKVNLTLNETIDEAGLAEATFSFDTGNSIEAIDLISENVICLSLQMPLPSGIVTKLTLGGITDGNGNSMEETTIELILTETPLPGDLVINELLYNPNSGNSSDYVELINISDKFLSLDRVHLGRANSSAAFVKIADGFLLKPGDIIAFADDADEIRDTYEPPLTANLHQLNITNYVNGEGNVWLTTEENAVQTTIDSLDYTDDFHSSLLTSEGKKGISIERITATSATNDPNNWLSAAASNNYGTPGYKNSQTSQGITGNEMVELENKVFSPNGDGFKDFAKLNFNLVKPGYIGNVAVYDDNGRLETTLAQNKSLGTTGSIIWEGTLADGTLAPVGMYIIFYEIYHEDGEVINGKKVCVLANQLN